MTLTVSYLAKARAGRLRATGRVTRAGRSVYFSCGELSAASGELIATAQGAFKRNRAASEV
jgi:acyl-coenzyme A thioesterase PaaI-like protein